MRRRVAWRAAAMSAMSADGAAAAAAPQAPPAADASAASAAAAASTAAAAAPQAPPPVASAATKKQYQAVGIPTPEQIMQEEFMNNCGTRTVVAGVMGASAPHASLSLQRHARA